MKNKLEQTLEKIEGKLAQLDIYNGPHEAVIISRDAIKDWRSQFIEAIAVKALDPKADAISVLKDAAKEIPKAGECKRGAKIVPQDLDGMVSEAVSEVKHSQLKVQPRSKGSHAKE